MEIPIIGRFLRGNKPSPEASVTPSPAAEPEIVLTRGAAFPVNETPELPDIDSVHIRSYVTRFKAEAVGDEKGREAIEKAKNALKKATPEVLEEMARTVDPDGRKPNFLREGDKVIIGWRGAHVHCAVAANMVPEDGGTIMKDPDRPTEPVILVMDGSGGFHIVPGNKNRPKTLEVLRQMAPGVIFEERITSVGQELNRMFGKQEAPTPRRPRTR